MASSNIASDEGTAREYLVVNVISMDSSTAVHDPGDSAPSSVVDSCQSPPNSGLCDRVGRTTFVRSVLDLNTSVQPTSQSEPSSTSATSSRSSGDKTRTEFTMNGSSYRYHGCAERAFLRPSDRLTSKGKRLPTRKFVDLHIIEQLTFVRNVDETDGTTQAGKYQPSIKPKPKPPTKPKPGAATNSNCRKQHAASTSATYARKLPPLPPIPAGQQSMPTQMRPSSESAGEGDTSLTPGKAPSPVSSNSADKQQLVDMLMDGKANVGAYILLVNATCDQRSFRKQEDFLLRLKNTMSHSAGAAAAPAILVSTKNDLLTTEETARQREQWVNDLGKKLSITECFHVSCKPNPVNICYAIDSLLAMALDGEQPAGEPSFVALKSKHYSFLSAATSLASSFASSHLEVYLSWKAWKECGGNAHPAYQKLLAADDFLGEVLAGCLHRHRILQRLLQEHTECCFKGDSSKVSRTTSALSVGKTTPEDLATDNTISRQHHLCKKLKNLPVLMKPVPKSSQCLYPVVTSVTRNCAPAKLSAPVVTVRGTAPSIADSNSSNNDRSSSRYIHVVERAARQSTLELLSADSEEEEEEEECYEVMQSFILDPVPVTRRSQEGGRDERHPRSYQDISLATTNPGKHLASPVVSEPALRSSPIVSEPALRSSPVASEPALRSSPVASEPALRSRSSPQAVAHRKLLSGVHASGRDATRSGISSGSSPASGSASVSSSSSSGGSSGEGLVAAMSQNQAELLTNNGYMEVPSHTSPITLIPVRSKRSCPAISPRRENFRKQAHTRAENAVQSLPHQADSSPLKQRAPIQPGIAARERNERTGSEAGQQLESVFTFGRQISRSMEDLRCLYEEIPSRGLPFLCERRAQATARPYYQSPPSLSPASQSRYTMASQQQSTPAAETAKAVNDTGRSKLVMKDVERVDSSSTMLRLSARHPDIPAARFDVHIVADTACKGWQQAMIHVQSVKMLRLKIKQ